MISVGADMEKSTDKYIGKILDVRYEILELIGTGGMANVYKALCHRLNRYDAKALQPPAIRF